MKFLAAAAQIGPRLGNLDANRELLVGEVRKAEERGVDLLVFPELSLTGYFLKDMVPEVAIRRNTGPMKEIAALSKKVSPGGRFRGGIRQARFFQFLGLF